MRTLIVAAALSALLPVAAEAITVTPTTVGADIAYTEPTTNADGTPLSDLHHCNAYAKPTTGAEIKSTDVPASAATGGGSRTASLTVPKGSVYSVTASCTDTSGNESARSAASSLDGLPPAPPK
jgi:hypothetical protein